MKTVMDQNKLYGMVQELNEIYLMLNTPNVKCSAPGCVSACKPSDDGTPALCVSCQEKERGE